MHQNMPPVRTPRYRKQKSSMLDKRGGLFFVAAVSRQSRPLSSDHGLDQESFFLFNWSSRKITKNDITVVAMPHVKASFIMAVQ